MSPAQDAQAAGTHTIDLRTDESPSRRRFLAGLGVGTAALAVPAVAAAQQGGGGSDDRRRPSRSPDEPRDQPTAQPSEVPAPTSEVPTLTSASPDVPAVSSGSRRAEALRLRQLAAEQAANRPHPTHVANGDERIDHGYSASFTKGLPHSYDTGLVARTGDYEQFVRATNSGRAEDFVATPLGPDNGFRTVANDSPLRAWESQGTGLAFGLIGPDPQAVTMAPAPKIASAEQTAEMAEVYAHAVLRDRPLSLLRHGAPPDAAIAATLDDLNRLLWFDSGRSDNSLDLDVRATVRRRQGLTPANAFRGIAPGDQVGPYISQLLLCGSPGSGRSAADGVIGYGAQTISQRVRQASPVDFMTSWDEWFDVQNGLAAGGGETYVGPERFITTGRDLATYVHSDALYQPYFNACLVLFSHRTPLDPGMPYQQPDSVDHQRGFVHFGGPHVLSMLAEVCSRALIAVKYQKFNIHRRLRPEALAARVEKADLLDDPAFATMRNDLGSTSIAQSILAQNAASSGTASMLLPMAFSEGSPMHPSYGAGHGTVAGACATILKALFDHTHSFAAAGSPSQAFVANADGSALDSVEVVDAAGRPATLTVEGEINKLAANVSIGRDWGGVHYFSDYWESMLLGQTIALQILEEQKLTIPEPMTLTVPLFEGGITTI